MVSQKPTQSASAGTSITSSYRFQGVVPRTPTGSPTISGVPLTRSHNSAYPATLSLLRKAVTRTRLPWYAVDANCWVTITTPIGCATSDRTNRLAFPLCTTRWSVPTRYSCGTVSWAAQPRGTFQVASPASWKLRAATDVCSSNPASPGAPSACSATAESHALCAISAAVSSGWPVSAVEL